MLRVGLTGGIGSGKSEVARRLAEHGAVLIDADVAARQVVEPGSPGLARIAAAFGDGVLRPDGSLNRERLGEIVFADPGLRAELNAIVHPLVREWMQEAEHAAVQTDGDAIVVHDVPLLAESRGKAGFDPVIVVDVPPELQLERLVRLRGMPAEQDRMLVPRPNPLLDLGDRLRLIAGRDHVRDDLERRDLALQIGNRAHDTDLLDLRGFNSRPGVGHS